MRRTSDRSHGSVGVDTTPFEYYSKRVRFGSDEPRGAGAAAPGSILTFDERAQDVAATGVRGPRERFRSEIFFRTEKMKIVLRPTRRRHRA
ncbi:hypothetical protein EVAR_28280_1 [Eumeta japonica]|uniref:Uncharacterized protein n=1 Tax=Eumeta variegata TaxID=151549 RepID=A0A4C1V8D6_EUMVA|nr:hypothetical protein EVAR_28280_1 [Eumeta japonica]